MKVGILTFHNAINYGAVLQVYALQQTILALGEECEIIDYSCPAVVKQYRRKKIRECISWKEFVSDLLSLHRLDKKKAAFGNFIHKYLILSDRVETVSGDIVKRYDAVIVGSDQVFNPKNTDGDSAYLLDFNGKTKKIAYAASVGNNDFLSLWEDKYKVDYKKLLSVFQFMSFRERETADFVSQLFGRAYQTVLDPVLLAGNTLWENFRGKTTEEYIFVYNLGDIPLLGEFVRNLHRKTGLKVYVVNKDIKGDILFHKYNNVSSLSPEDFLKMLSGATYVVTDSFHGTAFSVLFHKNFYSVVNSGKENTNSRILCLLEELKLESRIVSVNCDLNPIMVHNYDEVDQMIHNMRDSSLLWLKKSLNL